MNASLGRRATSRATTANWLWTAVMAAAALAAPVAARAEALLVPAYFATYGSGLTGWHTLATTARTVPTTVILNPDSGPGKSVDTGYTTAIANVHAAGGKVIGYVSTVYGKRSLSAVVKDINAYVSFYKLDGFFIDEMTADSVMSHIQYYQSVYNYIKGLSAAYAVTGNPGTNVPEIYASLPVADQLVVFEDSAKRYVRYAPQAWQTGYPKARFAHIVYAVNAGQVAAFTAQASARGAGSVYLTSKTLPDPYNGLPRYWSEETQDALAVH